MSFTHPYAEPDERNSLNVLLSRKVKDAKDEISTLVLACRHGVFSAVETGFFEANAWRKLCSVEAEEAHRCCGLSHVHYVEIFSCAIDRFVALLLPQERAKAIQMALDWGYATSVERSETQRELVRQGCCTHGFRLGSCPAGCGS